MAQQINVDIKPGAFQLQPTLYFSQGDIGRDFAVKIVTSDGFTIPVGATAELVGTKPSGFGFTVPCTIADGIVSFTATDTDGQVFTDEAGRFMAEIRIEDDGDVIGTANFYLQGEKDPHPEGTVDGEAEQIIPILAQLVTRIEAAADDVDEKYPIITQAKTDAVNAKNDAASAKDDAVLAKAGAESAAEDAEDAKDTVLASLDAAFIIETATGSIASFTDGANVPVKDLVAEIVPIQSGSGDPSPSNVRSISGWTECNITVASIRGDARTYNNADNGAVTGYFLNSDGTTTANAGLNITEYIPAKGGDSITIETGSYENPSICFYDSNHNYISGEKYNYRTPVTTTAPNGCAFIRFTYANIEVMFEVVATTHTISFASAGTVYGGRLDVTSGVLVVDRGYKSFDGSENWKASSNPDRYYVDYDDTTFPYKWASDVTAISNAYKYYGIGSSSTFLSNKEFMLWAPVGFQVNTLREVIFYNSSVGSLANFKTYLENNNVQVVFDLNDPITYQLTPTEVKTLLKNNNIWADTGDVTVEYVADTKTFIENLVNA